MAVDTEELEPLVVLLDDLDSVVTELVNSRLQSFGPEVVRSLRNRAERESDPERKALVVERGKWLNTEFKLADLQDFVTRSPGPLSLFEGSWIISSLLDWTLQRERYEDLFYRCSGEYLAEGSDQRTGVENIRILNHIFFHRLKFTLYDVKPANVLEVFYIRYITQSVKVGSMANFTIMLHEDDKTLDEVVVTASIVKIAYKGDTIEVNANAFNIPEGSMLSGLVGSIPGCELKPSGEILMNGRRVDYLLLNGKEFFRGDNSVMLDNLPYYVVQKLQFYEKEDKEKHASTLHKDYVMDVTLKRDYQIGMVGNTELAGGTSERRRVGDGTSGMVTPVTPE